MFHCHASVAYLCKNGRLACGRTLIFDMYGDDDMMADLLFAVSIVVVLRLTARQRAAEWKVAGIPMQGFFCLS